jgi:hypothetical protein
MEKQMKTILAAMLVATAFGLAGATGASAAPANGSALNGALTMQSMIEQAQYYYYRRGPRCRSVRVCRGYGYYRRCWWERRCY